MRILSLDGGGSWALLQVQALMDLYPQAITGHDVLRQFDYAVANSGGSLVLAGLIENMRLADLLAMFMSEPDRKRIFVELPVWDRIPRLIGLGPKYDAEKKLAGIAARAPVTGGMPVNTLGAHVAASTGRPFEFLIMSFDYDRQRAVFQRSTDPRPAPAVPTLAQAVHAATNAPVNYFDHPAKFDLFDTDMAPPRTRHRRFWDGAVGGYNNPMLAAVVETLSRPAPPPPVDITVLGVGTGSVALPMADQYPSADLALVQQRTDHNLIGDIKLLATAILDDPPDAATYIAHVWLGGRLPAPGGGPVVDGPVVRLNPLVQPVRNASGGLQLPAGLGSDDFKALRILDMDAVEQPQVELIRKFGEAWLRDEVTNQPVRADGYTMAAEVGFTSYAAARQAWLTRNPVR